jgi:hypothetical protein
MTHQVQLSDNEYQVILQLLQNERGELHPEIRRSTMKRGGPRGAPRAPEAG